jgi:pseudouridine-5'-phosphate glycosidase
MRVATTILEAVDQNHPVVALETAVLTHGFGPEIALTVYMEMISAVERSGAAAAPIGVLDGELVVGLDAGELARLSEKARKGDVEKAGVADLPAVCAGKASAGTTVAATLWAATRAGIGVFATGGIGGVHLGAERTFDISGDLTALGNFGGCVVCSGAKAICDLPKTLEMLETLGVTVAGYGTSEFPAFTCRVSGLGLRRRVDTPEAAAAIVLARNRLGLRQAVLLANPPPEEAALPPEALAAAVERATAEAAEKRISGPNVTPYLLSEMERLTAGDSVKANRALLASNASLAAHIAVALAASKVHRKA